MPSQRCAHDEVETARWAGRWKFIPPNRPPGTKRPTEARHTDTVITEPQLFDLLTDPGETTNLAATHPDKTKELEARLRQLQGARASGQ